MRLDPVLGSALAALLGVAGCDALPRDNFGTTERVRSERVLRAGAAHNPPWVIVEGGRVGGLEPRLLEAFARTHGAEVRWTTGAQIELSEQLKRKELEALVGGLDEKTPVKSSVSLTQSYATTSKPGGGKAKRVMAVMPGESRLLYELDRFLKDERRAPAIRRAAEEAAG